jgi:hypothetical protein
LQLQVLVVVECLILMMVMSWWLFMFNDWLITMVADSVCGLI